VVLAGNLAADVQLQAGAAPLFIVDEPWLKDALDLAGDNRRSLTGKKNLNCLLFG
jgi:hypothetical protein